MYSFCGLGLNIIGFIADKHNNQLLSDVSTIAGGVFSTASMINFIRSLEKYEDGDVDELFVAHLWNMLVVPTVDTISIAYSVASKERKEQIIKTVKSFNLVQWP